MREIECTVFDMIVKYNYMPLVMITGKDICTKNKWLKEQIISLVETERKKAVKEYLESNKGNK